MTEVASDQRPSTTSSPSPGLNGRRRTTKDAFKNQSNGKKDGFGGEEDSVTKLGKIYSAVLSFSVITRYAVFILPVAALLAVSLFLQQPLLQMHEQAKFMCSVCSFGLRSCGSVWVAKLIAQLLPPIFQVCWASSTLELGITCCYSERSKSHFLCSSWLSSAGQWCQ